MDPREFLNNNPHICRNCLNEEFGLNLQPKDIKYSLYPYTCIRCGTDHQMPAGFTVTGYLKIRFAGKRK